jgi:ankyrin repeat protein
VCYASLDYVLSIFYVNILHLFILSPITCDVQMGMTPLLTAASAGDVDIIQILLQHGANHHAQDRVR